LQKVHVEKKKSTKFACQFFLDFFFYLVFRCFSATGVQKHHKKRFAKHNRVEKLLQTKIDKKSKTDPFSIFFNQRFWGVRGIQKHPPKKSKINLTSGPGWSFLGWPLTYLRTYPRGSPKNNCRPLARDENGNEKTRRDYQAPGHGYE
jgi:hypothetical protein